MFSSPKAFLSSFHFICSGASAATTPPEERASQPEDQELELGVKVCEAQLPNQRGNTWTRAEPPPHSPPIVTAQRRNAIQPEIPRDAGVVGGLRYTRPGGEEGEAQRGRCSVRGKPGFGFVSFTNPAFQGTESGEQPEQNQNLKTTMRVFL